jgi:hypothetical protein
VVAIASFMVAKLHGVFGSDMYTPDNGNADAIIQFNPKHVLLEIFGAPGTVADINYLDEQAQPQRNSASREPRRHGSNPLFRNIRRWQGATPSTEPHTARSGQEA